MMTLTSKVVTDSGDVMSLCSGGLGGEGLCTTLEEGGLIPYLTWKREVL